MIIALHILTALVIILWMAFWARQHGGGDLGVLMTNSPIGNLKWITNIMFVLPIAATVLIAGHPLYLAALVLFQSALWFQTGHATAYDMGEDPEIAQSGRKETLSYVIDPFCNLLHIELGGTLYCWLFMLLKGFLIGWPLMIASPLLALAWPLGYTIGNKINWSPFGTYISEWLVGAICGLAVVVALVLLI